MMIVKMTSTIFNELSMLKYSHFSCKDKMGNITVKASFSMVWVFLHGDPPPHTHILGTHFFGFTNTDFSIEDKRFPSSKTHESVTALVVSCVTSSLILSP